MKFGIRLLHWLCLISAGAFYLAFIWKNSFLIGEERYFSLFDDAMVAMRYAKNLADGFGLRWNPGEPPVEGYTNLLWTLYMAAIHLLPIAMSKTSLIVSLSGAVILLANLVLVKKLTEAIAGKNSYAPLLAVFLWLFTTHSFTGHCGAWKSACYVCSSMSLSSTRFGFMTGIRHATSLD